MIIETEQSPEIYRALDWWKANIGFTNPNWNLLFYKIYAFWFTNSLSLNTLSVIKPDSLGSDFINEASSVLLLYKLDFTEEMGLSQWAYDLSFVLTAFYFLHPYHEFVGKYLR